MTSMLKNFDSTFHVSFPISLQTLRLILQPFLLNDVRGTVSVKTESSAAQILNAPSMIYRVEKHH